MAFEEIVEIGMLMCWFWLLLPCWSGVTASESSSGFRDLRSQDIWGTSLRRVYVVKGIDMYNNCAIDRSQNFDSTHLDTKSWFIGLVDLCCAIQGNLVNETRCLRCETVTSREEAFYDLSLEIEHNSSLTDCIKNFRSASPRFQHWFSFDRKVILLHCDASMIYKISLKRFLTFISARSSVEFSRHKARVQVSSCHSLQICRLFCLWIPHSCFDLWFVPKNVGSWIEG